MQKEKQRTVLMTKSKTPVSRKCISCGKIIEKTGLLRIARNKDGNVSLDENGKSEGRGAYICLNAGCVEKAFKKNALERSFRTRIDAEQKKQLEEEIVRYIS